MELLCLTRLKRSVERLTYYYVHNAPDIMKQVELSIIDSICKELSLSINIRKETI